MLRETLGADRCISTVGLCKNAGKTTALNRLVSELTGAGELLGLTSVGRDGESTDIVTGTAKPSIYVPEGTLFATASELLPLCAVSREIIDTTDVSTPLGQVILLRARSAGEVQLAGPSVVAQLAVVSDRLRELGADRVIVDGALGRRATASTALADSVVLCSGASLGGDMETVAAETAFAHLLLTLPRTERTPDFPETARFRAVLPGGTRDCEDEAQLLDALADGAEAVFFSGALSDAMVERFSRSGALSGAPEFIVGDSSRALISRDSFGRLEARGVKVTVARPIRVAAVTLNPFSARGGDFNSDAFLAAVRGRISAPVFDVMRSGK